MNRKNTTYSEILKRRTWVRLFFFFLTLSVCVDVFSQEQDDAELFVNVKFEKFYNGNTDQLLSIIKQQTGLTISYSNKVYISKNVSIRAQEISVKKLLDMLFTRLPVRYIVKSNKIIVAPVQPRYYTISGFCKDMLNGEALIGANVYDTLLYVGQGTNGYGFFSITLPEGRSTIRASFVGYQSKNTTIDLHNDTLLTIYMHPAAVIGDVTIVGDKEKSKGTQGSSVRLTIEQMRGMPSLLGETDVIKSLEWTPGVHSGEEGFGGMSVRGGNADENIVMLDDVPLYSPNHLIGLYSVFNSESVNSAELIKGGFAARYGGRMSSVLDVKMREGNMKRFSGYANIGLLSSNATFEGPIIKDKTSFILSARRTYFDIFSSQLQRNNDRQYSFCFYDIHAKLNHIISPKDRVYASLFVGYDNFGYGYNYRDVTIAYSDKTEREMSINDKQKVQWGNIVASLRWNHVFGSLLFCNTTFSISRYRFRNMQTNYIGLGNIKYKSGYYSGINDISARVDFNWYTPFMPSVIRMGTWFTYHKFSPGISVHNTNVSETDTLYMHTDDLEQSRTSRIYRFESHAYIEDAINLDKWNINVGLHLSSMITPNNSLYMRAEPRLQVGYNLTDKTRLIVSYSDMTQFLQQLRVATVASPADMWVPVSTKEGIPHSRQISGEVLCNVFDNIDVTTSVYLKQNINMQTYKVTQVVESILTTDWNTMFYTGRGKVYGAEFFVHKKTGQLSGFAGYSFMRATAQFDEINNGAEFMADNDRTHSVSVYGRFHINKRIDISATWQYSTGCPTTISDSRYVVMGNDETWSSYPVEGSRNAYRLPTSHTLNIGANIKKNKGRTERCLSFGIYNVYAHKNPMFVYWKEGSDVSNLQSYKLKQFSLIAWPWPYLKYSIKF